MQFYVNFILPNNDECLHIRNLTDSMGVDFIDAIQEEIGVNVPADQLMIKNDSCPSWNNGTIVIELKDSQLHKISQLKARPEVTVMVPDGFIGKYWELKIDNIGIDSTKYNFIKRIFTQSRMVSNFNVEYKLNKIQIISDWIEAGCPEYWGIDKDDETITDGNKYIIVSTNSNTWLGECKLHITNKEYLGGCIRDILLTNDFRGSYVDTQKCIINKKLMPDILFTLALHMNKVNTLKLLKIINVRIDDFEKAEAKKIEESEAKQKSNQDQTS